MLTCVFSFHSESCFSGFLSNHLKLGELNSPVTPGVHALRETMTTGKTWPKKCMADASLFYPMITCMLKNCLGPIQREAAESRSWVAEQHRHCWEEKIQCAQPSAENTSLIQDVNTLRNDCHQLRFFPSHCNTESSPYFPASFVITMFLPDHSFTFSFCPSAFYRSCSKG